jgi:hypothetical protein
VRLCVCAYVRADGCICMHACMQTALCATVFLLKERDTQLVTAFLLRRDPMVRYRAAASGSPLEIF